MKKFLIKLLIWVVYLGLIMLGVWLDIKTESSSFMMFFFLGIIGVWVVGVTFEL